jgi:hypothetical protein
MLEEEVEEEMVQLLEPLVDLVVEVQVLLVVKVYLEV